MATKEDLINALLGSSYNTGGGQWNRASAINSMLGQETGNLIQRDPFAMAGLNLSQNQLGYQPQLSGKQNLILNLMQGLGSGALTGFGRKRLQPKIDSLKTLSFGGTPEEIIKAADENPDYAEKMGQLLTFDNRTRELNQETEFRKEAAKAIAKNPEAADSIMSALENLRNPNAPKKPVVDIPEDTVDSDPLGLGKTYEQKLNAAIKEGRKMGMTGNAALEYGRTKTKPSEYRNKYTEETLKGLRDSGNSLSTMISTAEAGVAGAGETGGLGVVAGARNLASKAAALFSDDQQRKQTAQSQLDSISPDVLKAARVAGSGAMSDVEMATYLRSGPNSANTPEANRALIDKFKAVQQINNEYTNFLEFLQAQYGTVPEGADKLWQNYKQANPLFVQQGNEFVPNLNRPPVMQWLQRQEGREINQNAPAQLEQQTGTPPPNMSFEQFKAWRAQNGG